ncbi:CAP domain-containing protein [Rhodobacteraceae bacterium HSP-20]|uniref:CAP domain-containing protein n=1 Tax=Paragemmobacter amnigenus TaxID=2852097 RepID=A0ABS6J3F2_9RHOB|nr:CAP domain-containing protein [Rhodobacter amnigenus]MBV4389518.1 CAP domain-containing protein [Rhodobacter amnigenus]
MDRRTILTTGAAMALLSACVPTMGAGPRLGADGKPLPQVYDTAAQGAGTIEYRLLDSVNALRSSRGLQPLVLNAQLNAAAATHARDMSVQNRPWHFGSDGSSPLERVRRVGYGGKLLGELISETFETELETLATWMESPDMRQVILDPAATELGFAWFQEPNGKIWWTLVTGSSGGAFPMAGLTG